MSQVLSCYKSSSPHWITPAVTLRRVVQKSLSVATWQGSAMSVCELSVALHVNRPNVDRVLHHPRSILDTGRLCASQTEPHCCRTQLQMITSIIASFLLHWKWVYASEPQQSKIWLILIWIFKPVFFSCIFPYIWFSTVILRFWLWWQECLLNFLFFFFNRRG